MNQAPTDELRSVTTRTNLRHGYTTGACAAAAARAAAAALVTGISIKQVSLDLPAGVTATFDISTLHTGQWIATASVIKDAGDDPDITNGAEIVATVEICDIPGVTLAGGEGVGQVTRPGLGLEVGVPAINPVPRKMIMEAVSEVLRRGEPACSPAGRHTGRPLPGFAGLKVTISVPAGERLAKRTLNPRLGIIGGISILGTTGLVIPYSTDAYKTCISLALDVAVSRGCAEVALCTGARSEKFATNILDLPLEAFIQMGDFAGFSLDECCRRGLSRVHVCAFIGKLSKIASGNFSTHVSHGQLSPDFLPSMAVKSGIPEAASAGLKAANTARHFQEMVQASDRSEVFYLICRTAVDRCREATGNKLDIDCLLFDFDGHLLARAGGEEWKK